MSLLNNKRHGRHSHVHQSRNSCISIRNRYLTDTCREKRIYKKIPKHSAYRSGVLVQAYKKSFKKKYGNVLKILPDF